MRVAQGLVRGERGLDRHHHGVGACGDQRRACCARSRQQCAPESCRNDRRQYLQRRLEPGGRVRVGPDARRAARCGAGVSPLFSALGRHGGPGQQTRVLLHVARDSSHPVESAERDYRHVRARLRSRGDLLEQSLARNGLAPGFGPFLVGLLVWGIGLSLGGPTGYAINPARDLGPRIAHALLPIPGKGGSAWDYAAIPVLGPIIGAALAGLVVGAIHI